MMSEFSSTALVNYHQRWESRRIKIQVLAKIGKDIRNEQFSHMFFSYFQEGTMNKLL